MTEHLNNPPITEAILDIRVALPPETTLKHLLTFQDAIAKDFPEKKARVLWQGQVKFQDGKFPEQISSGGPDGYFFSNPTTKKIVQARLDGFTFNKLAPYTDWETIKPEAEKLWKHYIDIAKPTCITRIALRYINRLEIPLPIKELKEYILTCPDIAAGVPNAMTNFLMRLTIPENKTENIANVILTMEAPVKDGTALPLIFDIDTFRGVKLLPDDNSIWEMFETLRLYKNQIFHQSLTEKAKGMYR